MAEEDPYREIARVLVASAGGGWEKIIFIAESEPDWCTFEARIVRPGSDPTGLRINDATPLHDYLEHVQGIVKSIGGSRWKQFTFTLMRTGKFETEFKY